MITQLLTSKPKSNIINLFLAHPGRSFSLTELRVATKSPSKLLVQTIKELARMEFLLVFEKKKKRYYQINRHFPLYPELVNLIRKIKKSPVDILARELVKTGDCKFIALTGVFAGRPRMESDLLFVGKVSQKRLEKALKLATKFAEQQIGYTVFSPHEFEYRKIMNDRFVKNILENSPVIVLDRTKHRSLSKLVYKL